MKLSAREAEVARIMHIQQLRERIEQLEAENAKFRAVTDTACERLSQFRAIVDTLPKCWRLNEKGELVQDSPMYPGKIVYGDHPVHGIIECEVDDTLVAEGEEMIDGWPALDWDECCETLEAAEAVRKANWYD